MKGGDPLPFPTPMGIFASNKVKITATAIGGSGALLGIGLPHLLSSGEQPVQKQPEQPQPPLPAEPQVQQVKAPQAQPEPKAVPAQGETTAVKVNNLKNEKVKLLSLVENSTSGYKQTIGGISTIHQLEEALRKCSSRAEVNSNVTDEEKNKLKNVYTKVKEDIQEFEKINGEIQRGELHRLETEAEKRNDDEEKYGNFKKKFDETQREYQLILDKKSDHNFSALLREIKSKLNLEERSCSLKDLIKMNDALGERNRASG